MPRFSVVIPVYNRPDEVADLLDSLQRQSCRDFEVIIVEDGSTVTCRSQCEAAAAGGLDVRYFFKSNEGRSPARNYGMDRARGEWLVFFDSDCVIPSDYFEHLGLELDKHPDIDCYGGPDAAHSSFTSTQKAINHAMTSVLTTGGIRGGKNIDPTKFVPRTFNMGFRREVYDKVGGFREMFSEDIDMSTRIREAGFRTLLLPDCAVYHKRRVNFAKFFRQVHVFGMSRITLELIYPGSMKVVHALPAVAVIAGVIMFVLGLVWSWWWFVPLIIYLLAVFAAALVSTRSAAVSALAVPASVVQIAGYGTGFLRAYIVKILLGRGRDINQEIEMRRGK